MSRYEEAGVNIRKGEEAVQRIRELCRSTFTPGVVGDVGGFAGGFRVPGAPGKILLSSIDGVGTKLKVAILCDRHDTVGYDLVCHSGNDILVHGATPLFFLDYIAMGALSTERVAQLVSGLARGCRDVGCALIGGETAEMPGLYAAEDYDLAGAIVGIADESAVLDGHAIAPGDILLGLASVGLHTNGYSLARRILFDTLGLGVRDPYPGLEESVGDALLRPHPYYGDAVAVARASGEVRGIAHITGGGIPGNLVRVLPEGMRAEVARGSWPIPPIFRTLRDAGRVSELESLEVWNMGIGMILVVKGSSADAIERSVAAAGHEVHRIGSIVAGPREVRIVGG
jgi:phosphoribosylformylglycinamidine cyclo-ligase